VKRAHGLAVCALLAWTSACTSKRSEVVVRVWASQTVLARAATADVTIRGGEGTDVSRFVLTSTERVDLTRDATSLPIDVAVVPADGDATRHFEARVDLLDGEGMRLGGASVVSGFVEGRIKLVEVFIGDGCLGIECADGATCVDDARCVDARVDAATLSDYRPRDEQAPFDGGTDAGLVDAGPPAVREGGRPPPGCASAADCDDDNVCTSETCSEGRCVHVPVEGACDDGVDCTGDDTCHDGTCTGVPACARGVCNRGTGLCECSPDVPGC